MKKWKVRKRDGTWWVLDDRGRLRYSCGDHMMALSFAMLAGKPKPKVPWGQFISDPRTYIDHPRPTHLTWHYVIQPKDLGFETWEEAINYTLNQTDHNDPEEDDA